MAMKRQIISKRDTQRLGSVGTLIPYVTVEYMLDEYGPFVFSSPKDKFTYEALKKDADREEAGIEQFNK